jgi:hypothetical protein
MLKVSHKRSKTFAQPVTTIRLCSKTIETPCSDLSRR